MGEKITRRQTMKRIFLTLAILSLNLTSMTFAADSGVESKMTDEYSASVGLDVIVRTIVEKKLVDSDSMKILKMGLETGRVEFGKLSCDRGAGQDNCEMDVSLGSDSESEIVDEAQYKLYFHISRGSVYSANLVLIAG